MLVPKAEVVGGGPAGVVEAPKLKVGFAVAGVVEPNSEGADVVAGLVVDDRSGVPIDPKRLPVAGLFSVGPALVVVFCPSVPVVDAGFPKLPKLTPDPPDDGFPNKLGF